MFFSLYVLCLSFSFLFTLSAVRIDILCIDRSPNRLLHYTECIVAVWRMSPICLSGLSVRGLVCIAWHDSYLIDHRSSTMTVGYPLNFTQAAPIFYICQGSVQSAVRASC